MMYISQILLRNSFLLLFLLLCSQAFSQRKVDFGITTIEPRVGDTIFSPSSYNLSFNITNYGPDSAKLGDGILIKISLPGVEYGTFPFRVGIDIDSGETINFNKKLNAFFVRPTPTWICTEIVGLQQNIYKDSFDLSFNNKVNDTSCNAIYHQPLSNSLFGVKRENVLTAYPNPCKEGVTIVQSSSHAEEIVNIKVLNMIGAETNIIWQKLSDRTFYLGTMYLPMGVYIIDVSTAKGNYQIKIVKEE